METRCYRRLASRKQASALTYNFLTLATEIKPNGLASASRNKESSLKTKSNYVNPFSSQQLKGGTELPPCAKDCASCERGCDGRIWVPYSLAASCEGMGIALTGRSFQPRRCACQLCQPAERSCITKNHFSLKTRFRASPGLRTKREARVTTHLEVTRYQENTTTMPCHLPIARKNETLVPDIGDARNFCLWRGLVTGKPAIV